MYKLVPCCLLLTAFLNPLLSRPVRDSGAEPLLLSAPGEDARSTLDELEREFLRQVLPEMSGAEGGDGPRKADPSTNIVKAQGHVGKFQAFSGQDPNVLLSHLLARIRKQHKKRGPPPECFWKYCV
ncbi:urotensin-2 [Equus asinus]|uniref:Urotensin-2 n=2 Tax=Equus asinus TaxID=9793 RepID=A0A9L0J2A1_EQUAS|nr:urotensin-2 isoform X2 [Equus asinus]